MYEFESGVGGSVWVGTRETSTDILNKLRVGILDLVDPSSVLMNELELHRWEVSDRIEEDILFGVTAWER